MIDIYKIGFIEVTDDMREKFWEHVKGIVPLAIDTTSVVGMTRYTCYCSEFAKLEDGTAITKYMLTFKRDVFGNVRIARVNQV